MKFQTLIAAVALGFTSFAVAASAALTMHPWTPEITRDFAQVAKEAGLEDTGSRGPASVQQRQTASARAALPAGVTDGFAFRVQNGTTVSMFWVVKRKSQDGSNRYDLVFGNNSGSRVNLDLPYDRFNALQSEVLNFKNGGSTAKCQTAKIDVSVQQAGHPARSIASCLAEKTQPADQLRQFAALLSAFIQ